MWSSSHQKSSDEIAVNSTSKYTKRRGRRLKQKKKFTQHSSPLHPSLYNFSTLHPCLSHSQFLVFLNILAQLCNLAPCMWCVLGRHGNLTTYCRPQSPVWARRAFARFVPEPSPCQRWHELKAKKWAGWRWPWHIHEKKKVLVVFLLKQAHRLDILPFFLAGASHGSSRRNPFSMDAGAAVVLPLTACSYR